MGKTCKKLKFSFFINLKYSGGTDALFYGIFGIFRKFSINFEIFRKFFPAKWRFISKHFVIFTVFFLNLRGSIKS